jgi:hypothetical protein
MGVSRGCYRMRHCRTAGRCRFAESYNGGDLLHGGCVAHCGRSGDSEKGREDMMEHLDLAPEALQAFSAYAQKMVQLPETNDVLILRIHSDGSGCICAATSRRPEYIIFRDLADLLQQLREA